MVADVSARAQRRFAQLRQRGQQPDEQAILEDLRARDARDTERCVAPLKAAEDAYQIDSSDLSVEQTVAKVLELWQRAHTPIMPKQVGNSEPQ